MTQVDRFLIGAATFTLIAVSALAGCDGGDVDEITAPPQAVAAQLIRLFPNAPNPFTASTRLSFQLLQPGEATLQIFDSENLLVRTLFAGSNPAGNYSLSWDGHDARGQLAPSGVYVARLVAGGESASIAMTLAR